MFSSTPIFRRRQAMVGKLWFAAFTLTTAPVVLTAQVQQSPVPPAPEKPLSARNDFRDDSRTGPSPQAPKPTNLVSPETRGDILMARKMYLEAAEAYMQGPKDSAVLLNKTGIAFHQMLELRAAEKYYRLAIKVNPQYSEAINNIGTIYYAHKSYRRAINEYRRALRIDPKAASIWSNLGTGYFSRKDYPRAEEAWQQALALDPDVFETRSTQGVLLQERSVEDRAKFHYLMAEGYAKKGMVERALLYIRKAFEEGYKDRKKVADDPAFASLKDMPEFKQLLAMEPRVL
jgi:tetratricopeptide (TPR) repeat protein